MQRTPTNSFIAPGRGRSVAISAATVVLGGVAIAAWSRVGLLDLPRVPGSVTLESAGLSDLEALAELDAYLRGGSEIGYVVPVAGAMLPRRESEAVAKARLGILRLREGDAPSGLESMREGIRLAPQDLALTNAYRMEVFRLRREFLHQARAGGSLTPQFPPHLDRQPIAFFEELAAELPLREVQLQLALAWVDEMLLFPALEIKAPSSVQAVDILTALLEGGNENYVPALFARGLNHLHRPARLVWPESAKTPIDAAAQDISRCIAIGRKLGLSSPRLQATLAMTLGDSYVKAGRLSVARSWWQIAQNLDHSEMMQSAVRRRYSWPDERILDELELELDRARSELDHPMTDLATMWSQ